MENTSKRLRVGEGKISGIVSIFLGLLSLIGLLCFRFPEWLTTPDLREVYTGEMMEKLIFGAIIVSFIFSLVSFVLSKQKRYALIGLTFCVLTVILGGFTVAGRSVEKVSWSLGLDWLIIDLLLMAILFVPIEMVFPKRDNQPRFHEEWRTDLVYFIISHLFIQLFGVISKKPATALFGGMNLDGIHVWVQSLPFVVELFLALLITDLFQYWTHRFFHSHHYLWRFHSVHHSTKAMDWLAGSRTHFVDIFVTRTMSFIPLYVMGFSTITFNTYIIFIAIHAVLIHANTRINFGFLKYIISTPQFHHWHHCLEPEFYGKNFAVVFPFIDRIFGTYYLPENVWPQGTGLHEAEFPKGYVSQMVYPFKKNPFKNDLSPEQRTKR